MSSKLSHQSTQSVTAQEGFRNPHLLQELRAEWGIAVDAPLIVIGRLREHTLSGGGSIFFLEDLENSVSGVGLTYPMRNEHMQTKAYVPHSEVSRVRRNKSLSGSDWAIAELQLSPAEEREKRSNPHECRVKQGTLGLLQDVPDQWNLTITGPVSAQRITAAAREAIKGQVRKIEGQVREESIRLDEIVNLARVKKDTEEQKLELVRKAIRSEQLHLEDINQQFLRETQLMENRFRRLNALMAEKGQRLVALDLIDEDDLQGLMPEANSPDERPGIDFHGALDGNLARLAPFVQARLWKRGMLFSKAQLRDYLTLLRTHDLLVLAGDSGSGKTSLIRAVAESIGGHCTVVPVKPNWTGPEDLLGYYNPIERSYQPTPFLLALQAAAKEPEVPHFICLDEMNLARIEHYFADFLSLLETRSENPVIPLYTSDEERHTVVENSLFLAIEAEARARSGLPENATLEDMLKNEEANRLLHQLGGFQNADSVLQHHARLRRSLAAITRTPTSLQFPPNVRIIGSINIDDTTHYLSPKVLDRVHVMRFPNPVLTDWDKLESEVESFDLDLDLPLRLSSSDLGSRTDYPEFDRKDEDAAFLMGLAKQQLDPLGVEFGLRAIRQSTNYIRQAEIMGIGRQAALNNVVLHKILPKLMLDIGRVGSDGRSRRDILIALRDDLATHMEGLDSDTIPDSCVEAMDKLIASADSNNGIANYWLR